MSIMPPTIDWCALAARTMQRCDDLARDSEEPDRLTRRFCTPALAAAHRRLGRWFEASGLSFRVDEVANLIGSTTDANAKESRKRLLIGSHLDTVPGAGRYDGVLGVLIGLAVAEAVRDAPLPFDLEVIGFSDEEGARYRSPYLGSRGVAGTFDTSLLDRPDKDGITMSDALRSFGCEPNEVSAAAYDPQSLIGFIEAHIEQGPLLESENISVGVVTAFAGQTRFLCRFDGKTGHAGTVPMTMRNDAGLTASRFHIALNDYARAVKDLRATVGYVQYSPGASNVIPGRAELHVEVRHADDEIRDTAVDWIKELGQRIASENGAAFSIVEQEDQPAVRTDARLITSLTGSIANGGYPVREMVSGAGHDSVVMAGFTPTATLFLRNPGGISHHADERVEESDVAVAIEVLTRMVCQLDVK